MSEERDMINEVPGSSPEFRTELAEQLAELAPEAIADGKIDVEKLKELLEGDASDTSERFGLFWPGKKRAMRAAQTPTTATLRPDKENSKDWDTTKNVFIEGDNLEVLKILQKHYHGKIKMIYIDPPYNTGKEFVYPDNFKEGLETYLEWSKQINKEGKKLSSNSEAEGRYHSNWLNMLYPRLKLARNLLADDGVILISIDDHEQQRLRDLADEVFGQSNFLATLIWDTNHSAQSGVFKVYHQYVHVYARKSVNVATPRIGDGEEFEAGAQKRPSSRHVVSEFTFPAGTKWDAQDGTELAGTWGGSENTTLVKGRMLCVDGKLAEEVTLAAAWTQKAQMEQFFRGDRESLYDSRGQKIVDFYFTATGKVKIVKKREVLTPSTVRRDYGSQNSISNNLARLFGVDSSPLESPKPVKMIKEFIEWFTSGEDIVLDFFAGSGTTGHALAESNFKDGANRRYILVQLPEPTAPGSIARELGLCTISDIARERLILAEKAISSQSVNVATNRNSGFRSFKLADTNFTKWRSDSHTEATQLEQHLFELRESADDNATPEDLLTEILIKQGHSLVEQIRDREIGGLSYKAVVRVDDQDDEEDTLVLAYLDERTKPSLAQLRAAMDVKPTQFIMLEDAFQGDDELKTNLAQICKTNGIELWTA